VVTSYTYTDLGLIDEETDPLGRVTDYDYDSFGRLTQITYAKDTSDEASQQFEYDAAGNQTAAIDENGIRTEYKYDEMNQVMKITYAVGTLDEATELMEYDDDGNLVATVNALGNRTEYEYDKMGWQVRSISPDPDPDGELTSPVYTSVYDLSGNLISSVDPLGRETRSVYDERFRLVKTINPDGSQQESEYDLDNREIASIDANGHETRSVYNGRGQLISMIRANGNTTYFEVNAVNQVTTIVEPSGNRTKYKYDDLGRQTVEIQSSNTPLTTITRTLYDKVGNIITKIDGLGHKTKYEYDNRDRQIVIKDALNGTTITKYDDVGNVISLTDSGANTTTFSYDARNRQKDETNELGYTQSFTYDKVGNLTKISDRNGRERSFIYDDLNRKIEENWLDYKGSPIRTINSTHDAASQLTNISDPDSSYSFTYDLLGRLARVDNAGTPDVPNTVLNYTYDPNGNVTSVSDSIDGEAGGITRYTYNELDRVNQITQTGNGVADKRVDFTYNAIGQYDNILRYADLEGNELVVQTDYTYNKQNNLKDLIHTNSSDTINKYNFVYDAASRIKQITDIDGITDYVYDKTDQLINADHSDPGNPDEFYTYDATGNRITSSQHDNGYITGENNQLLSDGIYNYEYDNEGNLSSQTDIATGAIRELKWDYRDRLVAVIDKDSSGVETQRVEFTYDVMDHRIAKTVDSNPLDNIDGVVTHFVYDRDNVLLDFVDNNVDSTKNPKLHVRYLHGTQIDQVLAQEDIKGNVIWDLTDHLGTIRDLVNNNGAVINHLTYDSFGNIISKTNDVLNTRYLFTGREFDKETGLYYYRARYYNPSTGRFIIEDPIGFDGVDVNLYRYVGNSPIYAKDPSGLITFIIPGGGGEFGNLPANIAREARFPVVSISNPPGVDAFNDPFGLIRAGFVLPQIALGALVRRFEPGESINIIAHSDGNRVVSLLLGSLKDYLDFACINVEINWGRLDPTGVFKPPSSLAYTFDIASNNPFSRDPRDIAAIIWFSLFSRPDYRADFGVSHMELLNNQGVLRELRRRFNF
jgi:RHS repeat-associated protein